MPIYTQLINNKNFDLENPDIDLIDIEDIANALSNICRFNGNIKKFYSVAQHCCFCTSLAVSDGVWEKDRLLAVLMHDASEAYTGDIIKPVKEKLEKFRDVEFLVESAINKKFNIDIHLHKFVKHYDTLAYEYEKMLKIDCSHINCWPPKKARDKFLKDFNKYA